MNNSITPKAVPIVKSLNDFFSNPIILEQLRSRAHHLISRLSVSKPYAVEDFSIQMLGKNLPKEAGSIRVAVFFPNAETKVERHPNSKQFLYSIMGSGTTKVLRNRNWEIDSYGEMIKSSVLESQWHFIEQNHWHQSIATGNKPWALVAIHTAKNVLDEYKVD